VAHKVNRSPIRIHCVSDEVKVVCVVFLEERYPRCKHSDDPRSPSSRAVEAADLHRLGRRLDHSRNDHRSNHKVLNPDVFWTARLLEGSGVWTRTLFQKSKVKRDGIQSDRFCFRSLSTRDDMRNREGRCAQGLVIYPGFSGVGVCVCGAAQATTDKRSRRGSASPHVTPSPIGT